MKPTCDTQFVDMTPAEAARLEECEQTINEGLRTFVEVGKALSEIRDARLYRASHGTFEAYCRDRWGMTDRSARRFIEASNTVSRIGPIGPVPNAESQVRPLTKLPPEQQREAWAAAVDTAPNGKVTAKHVEATVKRMRSEESPPQTAPPPPQQEIRADTAGSFDLAAELEHAHEEISRLEALVSSLEADDLAKEVAAWARKYAQLEGRLQQAMTTGNEAAREAKYAKGLLKKIRDVLGVERDSQILSALMERAA